MTWLNPLALLGLLAVGVPIIVHLFGRRMARRLRFPSLRLLPLAAPTPTTRSQPSDLLLLVLRCAVVVAAAVALAQPLLMTGGRDRSAQVPARVIVLDTSASMRRLTSDGSPALENARAMAAALLDSAREGMVIETAIPGRNVGAAASWLSSRSGARELVVVSDFQLGAVSEGDFAGAADGIGVRLAKVATVPASNTTGGGGVRFDGATTEAAWTVPPAIQDPAGITVLTSDTSAGRIATEAAQALVASADSGHAVDVVFPDYTGTPALRQQLEPLSEPWQGEVLLELTRSEVLRPSPRATSRSSCEQPGVVVPNAAGDPVATVSGAAGGRLVVFSCSEIGTVASASLIAAAMLANRNAATIREADPLTVPDSVLRQWERPATAFAPRGREDSSPDGRWFWVLALVLLGVEEWLRRGSPSRDAALRSATEQQQRVA